MSKAPKPILYDFFFGPIFIFFGLCSLVLAHAYSTMEIGFGQLLPIVMLGVVCVSWGGWLIIRPSAM